MELPDDVARAIKARATAEGRSVKELLADLLRAALGMRKPADPTGYDPLPTLKSRHPAPPGQEMTPERVAEVLWGTGEP